MATSANGTITRLATRAVTLLGGRDLEHLPALHCLEVGKGYRDGRYEWQVKAQLSSVGTELDHIDAVRRWAQALGGVVLLDDPHLSRFNGTNFRTLSALCRLDDDVLFEIWTHIAITSTPLDASASELIAA